MIDALLMAFVWFVAVPLLLVSMVLLGGAVLFMLVAIPVCWVIDLVKRNR